MNIVIEVSLRFRCDDVQSYFQKFIEIEIDFNSVKKFEILHPRYIGGKFSEKYFWGENNCFKKFFAPKQFIFSLNCLDGK